MSVSLYQVYQARPSRVNLISKDTSLVFYLLVYQLVHSSNKRLNDVVVEYRVNLTSWMTSLNDDLIKAHAVR